MRTSAIMFSIIIFLIPLSAFSETFPEIDVENLFARKKALVKETMQLTEKESAVFWPLYDDYVNNQKRIFNKRKEHIREYVQKHKSMSDTTALIMINEYLKIEADALRFKQEYFKKFSKKLPPKRAYQYFVMEEQMEAGFFALIAEALPPIK